MPVRSSQKHSPKFLERDNTAADEYQVPTAE